MIQALMAWRVLIRAWRRKHAKQGIFRRR